MRPSNSSRLTGGPRSEDQRRWLELLDQISASDLVDTFTSRVGTVHGYDPPPVPLNEIRRTALLTFDALIEHLRSDGLGEPVTIAVDVGVTRARAGIPLAALMTAIRLDFVVLWEAITRCASVEDAELIVRYTEFVLSTVDEYSHQTQRAYVAERQRMHEEEASVRQGLIAVLLQEPRPEKTLLDRTALDLGMPADVSLLVLAARGDDIPPLRVAIAELERAGARIFTHHLGETLIAFGRQLTLPGSRLEGVSAKLSALRIGMTISTTGLAGLYQSAATASELAALLTPDDHGAMTWIRGWARLAARGLENTGNRVLADVDTALDQCGEVERIRLEEAVRSYLDTGSTGATARDLFCHRNTIANRLRRFADITGIDPTVPSQAARLVVGWA